MATPLFHEFKKKASFLFREKINVARLLLTDVTHVELLTEEVASARSSPPDTPTMRAISKAAFEVDEYFRIVQVLRKRVLKVDRQNWRSFYNALVLLEYLIVHGPLSIAKEFQCDQQVIQNMGSFQYVDEKGFDWGKIVSSISERVVELLRNESLVKEERAKARRQPVHGRIVGYESFAVRKSSKNEGLNSFKYGRSNSLFNESKVGLPKSFSKDGYSSEEENHPFCEKMHEAGARLISPTGFKFKREHKD